MLSMYKKLITALLVLAMLLCGCTGQIVPTETIPSTSGTTAAVDYLQNVKDLAQQRTPAYNEEPAIAFDPDRKIYIHVPKHDMDLYGSGLLTFWVYSMEPLNLDEIQLQLDCKSEYALLYVEDYSEYCHVKHGESNQFPQFSLQEYQHYCLLGMDWKELGMLKAQAKAAFDLANETVGNQDAHQSYRNIYEEYQAAYGEKTAENHNRYTNLTTADIPQFYLYFFNFKIGGSETYEETIVSAKLFVNGDAYPMDLGQLRLHKSLPQVFMDNQALVGLSDPVIVINGLRSSPYNGCIEKVEEVFSFDAEKDMTITGIGELTYGTEMQILAAKIRIKGHADYFWDMQRPIDVEAGSHVDIDLYLQDSRFEEYDPCIITYFFMNYSIGPKSYVCPVNACFQRTMLSWDTFLMAFKGIDIGEYYIYMKTPYNNDWLQELPESLRK